MPLERRHRSILRPTESLKRSGEDWALMLHFYLNLKLELLYEKRILTSKACHRELRSFRVNGRVWTFSGTVCVDLPWDDKGDLVDITSDKFRKRKGSPNGPMRSNAWSLVHLALHPRRQGIFLCADFSKLPKQAGIPCGHVS